MNKKRILQITLLAAIVIAVALYFLLPSFNSSINNIISLFNFNSVDAIIEYIRSFGIYAVMVSIFLMVFQSVLAPLPAFLITFANAAVFGWWQGAIISWSGAMLGAALCFFIAKLLGREVVEKLTSKLALEQVDKFFVDYGRHTILIARLLPFVSFDIVSYAAGLTSMKFWAFFIATGIGQLPATIVYSYVGGMLTGGAQLFVTGLFILFALSILIFMLKQIFQKRKTTKGSKKERTV